MQGKLHAPTLKEQEVAGMFKIKSNSVLRNKCLNHGPKFLVPTFLCC